MSESANRTRRSARQPQLRMGLLAIGLSLGWLAAGPVQVRAQGPTTVQLPTIHEFSVNTTVSVPDRGGMILGGVNSSSMSSVSRGIPGGGRLFTNRAIGRETGSSTASVHVWIHDLAELDAATLAAARRVSSVDAETDRKAAFITKNLSRSNASTSRPATRKTSQR